MNPEDLKALVTEVVREVVARGTGGRRIALGADHGGFELKARLKDFLEGQGHRVLDLGTDSREPCDYPDFARAVALEVASGRCEAGIVIDGAGLGSAMVCNKVAGIRAAPCHDLRTALSSRQHNDANVLALGAGTAPPEGIEAMVKAWLETPFEGGRHQRRVDKIERGA